LFIAAVSFVVGFNSGVATAPGGGDAPGDGGSSKESSEGPRRVESPKRDSLGHDNRILFGKLPRLDVPRVSSCRISDLYKMG
jgi:hypothetical protein